VKPATISWRKVSRATRILTASCSALAFQACGLLGGAPPPPVRGVVLVLAPGAAHGAPRPSALARLAEAGRVFESALAPDPDPARARAALLGEGDAAVAARLAARGVAVESLAGEQLADPAAAARVESWLRTQQKFVLVAGVGDAPGAPAGPPPALLAGVTAPSLPRIAYADLGFSDPPGGEIRPAAWSEPARRRVEAVHLERALATDRQLAELLALVERAAPEAAVVVVPDPSPDTGAHGRLERPDALFDDTLRSSIVVRTPGLARPGRASNGLVSTLDVVPTLFELLGMPPEPGSEGRSLMPLLASPSARGRDEVLSSVPRRAGRLGKSIRSPRYRYTEWPDGSRELYDHDVDPGEIRNLAGSPEHAAAEHELSQALRSRPPSGSADPPKPAPRPGSLRNVVLIVVDDLNVRVGAWDAPVETPSIDRLAARGVRFDRAYAQVAMCSPSRVSLLTGLLPERTGVWQNEDPPRPRLAVPLQEHFAAHGALTISIGKIYHSPADFEWGLREHHPEVVEERDPSAAGEGQAGLWVKAKGGDLDQPDGRRARRAAVLLSETSRRPRFLALGLVRPHVRWVVPERYFGLYPPESIAPVPVPADDLADVPAIAVKTLPQPLPGLPLAGREPPGLVADPAFRRQAIAAYQACVSFADAQVGVVLDALDRHDRWKDTVVVLVGDNGFHLGEHGGLLRKDTLFEEALRVPLVIAAPGLRAGTVVQAPVELVDVYPTLVELAGLAPPPGLDGRSLAAPLLAGETEVGTGYARSWRRVRPPERGHSLRTERLRYTLWPDGSEELYERRGEGVEADNLAAKPEWSAEKARLRARLEALVAPPRQGTR
jgi:arylsulfatase A-like enzyme